jgi:hypothetical protein
MAKKITDNQLIGELGEAAVRKRFLSIGFQFDHRSRLEAGIDGLAEVMIDGEPTARMIAVQIKSTRVGKYRSETATGFTYLLELKDLQYWSTSNLPVILVLYRESDDSHYWSQVQTQPGSEQRLLTFDKACDQHVSDHAAPRDFRRKHPIRQQKSDQGTVRPRRTASVRLGDKGWNLLVIP